VSKPTLKAEVRRRLDDVAGQTSASIAVINSPFPLSSHTPPDGINTNTGWLGLETERICELLITGSGDSVDLARVRLLVMLDELVRSFSKPKSPNSVLSSYQSGLHAETCDIDHKLHAIIAGRKRGVLQTIQEETATNIYLPSPLQGLVGPAVSNPAAVNSANGTSLQEKNVIWITGEFLGVQRARDMLFQISVTKVVLQMT
jgi:hypothetical protein